MYSNVEYGNNKMQRPIQSAFASLALSGFLRFSAFNPLFSTFLVLRWKNSKKSYINSFIKKNINGVGTILQIRPINDNWIEKVGLSWRSNVRLNFHRSSLFFKLFIIISKVRTLQRFMNSFIAPVSSALVFYWKIIKFYIIIKHRILRFIIYFQNKGTSQIHFENSHKRLSFVHQLVSHMSVNIKQANLTNGAKFTHPLSYGICEIRKYSLIVLSNTDKFVMR